MLITIPLLSRLDMQIDRNMIIYSIIRVCIQTHNNCNMVIRVRTNHFQHTKNYQRARRLRSPTCKYFPFYASKCRSHPAERFEHTRGNSINICIVFQDAEFSCRNSIAPHEHKHTASALLGDGLSHNVHNAPNIYLWRSECKQHILCARPADAHSLQRFREYDVLGRDRSEGFAHISIYE